MKPLNILNRNNNKGIELWILADFGIVKQFENTLDYTLKNIGTASYMSPECCEGQVQKYSSDIWSSGIILCEITC